MVSIETELKLALPRRAAVAVMTHPVVEAVAAGDASHARLLSVYYDTTRFDLWSAGISLRLRRTPTGWLQTLKRGGTVVGGLHRREEIEMPVAGQALELARFADWPSLEALRSDRFVRRLAPIFRTCFSRTTRMLKLAEGSEIELSLDRGYVEAGKLRAPLCELELEIKAGGPAGLFDVAHALSGHMALRPVYRSKAHRGYALAGMRSAPARAARVALTDSLSIAQASQLIVTSGLEQIQANEDGVLAGGDGEYLHQMRVGVRRLRACFAMLRRVVPAARLDPVRAELKWLNARLGSARGWDVFVREMLPQFKRSLGAGATDDALEALGRAAAARGERAQRLARSALRSQRVSRLLLELGRIAAGGGLVFDGEGTRMPARVFTATLLQRRCERVLARGVARKCDSAAALHALRIAVKKLRYAVEFFGGIYPAHAVKDFRDPLLKLQDCLGTINDAYTMRVHVRSCLPADAELADCLVDWSAHVIDHERIRLRKPWRRFRQARAFW